MIKNNKITINISYRNKTHYLKLGYNPDLNKKLEVDISHLPSSSHQKIEVICEICSKENKITYHKYILNKKRHGFYGCRSCSRQKAALTSMDKWGVDNYSKTTEYKERVEKTNIKKYGFKTNLVNPEFKDKIKVILQEKYETDKWYEIKSPSQRRKFKLTDLSKILNQNFTLSEDLYQEKVVDVDYLNYKNECRRLTKKSIKILLDTWDGIDFYDGEYIRIYFNLDHNDVNYPTIDHKISIHEGFKLKIDASIIGGINNLCMTKRKINSSKRDLNVDNFNLQIESQKKSSNLNLDFYLR